MLDSHNDTSESLNQPHATPCSKEQALELVSKLKNLANEFSDNTSVAELKEILTTRASELTSSAKLHVSHAYEAGKEKASNTVKEHPIGTIAVAAGVGLLLGYVLGSKSSK